MSEFTSTGMHTYTHTHTQISISRSSYGNVGNFYEIIAIFMIRGAERESDGKYYG